MAKGRRISLGTLDEGRTLTVGTEIRGAGDAEVVRETAKAVLLSFAPLAHGSRPTEVWLPKSQYEVAAEPTGPWGCEVTVPAWWVHRNNLWRHV